jgi:RNA polymerase sigma-70 factor (ECF subfamily)
MHDARDAEDRRLSEEGEHKLLLASYFHPVRERCFLALRDRDAADEAAQHVFLRLLRELQARTTYPVPFRVVVWMVTTWTLRSLYPAAKMDAALPDDWNPAAPDAYAEWEDEHYLTGLLADLPPRQREVLDLAYREGLSPAQIAERLAITRNAVDQALHNGHKRLAEKLRG